MAAHRIRHQLEAAEASAALVQVMLQQSKLAPPMTINEIRRSHGSCECVRKNKNEKKTIENGVGDTHTHTQSTFMLLNRNEINRK